MIFEVIVLGASGTYPTPDSACSGYLLRYDGTEVWIDAGTGTFANLQKHTDFLGLDAMVLSHMHPDHVLDVFPFYQAVRFYPTEPIGFPVYAPLGSEGHLLKTLEVNLEPPFRTFAGYLDFRTVGDRDEVTIGPFEFNFVRTVHPIETLAMRVEAGGYVLAYSADTGPTDDVMKLVKDADVFIVEATLQKPNPELAQIHLTAEEAGMMASEAGVGRVVLTHLWPGLDPAISVCQAAEHFDGDVVAAYDNMKFVVGATKSLPELVN